MSWCVMIPLSTTGKDLKTQIHVITGRDLHIIHSFSLEREGFNAITSTLPYVLAISLLLHEKKQL